MLAVFVIYRIVTGKRRALGCLPPLEADMVNISKHKKNYIESTPSEIVLKLTKVKTFSLIRFGIRHWDNSVNFA